MTSAFPPEPERAGASGTEALRSEGLFRLFAFYLRLRLRGSFNAVRVSGPMPALPAHRPAIIYGNHPSWWDPALYLVLADLLFRGRPGYGPMDAESLARYPIFRRLGVFGIAKGGLGGARHFLEVARHTLGQGRGRGGRAMIWITAEGDFTDPRVRPVRLRPGLSHLARMAPDTLMVPMAVEYVFWNESRPELLIRFGAPLAADATQRPAAWNERLQAALAVEMDQLARDSASREKSRFRTLLRGRAGSGVMYDQYRRVRAALHGRRFSTRHEEEA